jgi:hypothetical protein
MCIVYIQLTYVQISIKKNHKLKEKKKKKIPTFSIFQIHSSMCIVCIQLTNVQISIKISQIKKTKTKKNPYIFYISASQFKNTPVALFSM